MEEKHRLTEEINFAIGLQMLATAYEEISVIKMRFARDSVVHTRGFLFSLSNVFYNVKSSYKNRVLEAMKQHTDSGKPLQFTTHQTNGKEIHVFLSANNKLYGEILSGVFELFKQRTINSTADVVIVGKAGEELYKNAGINKPYTYFQIPDIESTIEDLKPVLTHVLSYETVTVFHGKFINVITQEPFASNITGDVPLESGDRSIKEYSFIFEPSIEELLTFFQSQMFFALFKQTIHEAELARYASRIKAMEEAMEYIHTRLQSLTLLQKRVDRRISNKRQLERIAGMSLWRK